MLAGVNLTFFPQHLLGLWGIPRRYYDFHSVYYYWHEVSRIGASLSLGATLILIIFILQGILEKKSLHQRLDSLSPLIMERIQLLPAEAHRFEIEPFHISNT